MAELKNVTYANIGITSQEIYVCPVGKKGLIIGFTLANTLPSLIQCEVKIFDASKAQFMVIIPAATYIEPGQSLLVPGGSQKIVLEEGDKIFVKSSDANSVDAFASLFLI